MSPGEPFPNGHSGAVVPMARPKGPPAALPAASGSAAAVTEPEATQATRDVASPTGVKPPPAADLPVVAPPPRPTAMPEPSGSGESAGGGPLKDDDTAPMPVISADDDPPAPASAADDRVRDPFEPMGRSANSDMAQLVLEQRRSAARTSESLTGSTQPAAPASSPPPSPPTPSPSPQPAAAPQKPSGPKSVAASPSAARPPSAARSASTAPRPARPKPSVPAGPPPPPGAAKLEQIKDLYLTAEAIGEDALDQHFEQVSEKQRQLIKEYFDQIVRSGKDGQASS